MARRSAAGTCDEACYATACRQAATELADGSTRACATATRLRRPGPRRSCPPADGDGDAATDADAGVWSARLTGELEADVPAVFQGERDE
jgi:hypothetical protein